jgi:UDP-N-acetylglucosamine 1-carboxyvinyltransferase
MPEQLTPPVMLLRGTAEPAPLPLPVHGSKNCFNSLMAVALLGDESLHLRFTNVPPNSDRITIASLIRSLGVDASVDGDTFVVRGAPTGHVMDPAAVRKIRAMICYAVALAVNTGQSVFPFPGGDAFTSRPIDLHLKVLSAAGARYSTDGQGLIHVWFDQEPRGFELAVASPFGPSVGASVSALVTAARAQGTSRISGMSDEPEVLSVMRLLSDLGVAISIEDRGVVRVEGTGAPLGGTATVSIPPDRMEAGTYLLLGLIRHSRIELTGITQHDLPEGFRDVLSEVGVAIDTTTADQIVARRSGAMRPVNLSTAVHPGFPTDLQPQMSAFLTQVDGRSSVTETVYPERTSHVPQLARLGIHIAVSGQTQFIQGRQEPRPAEIGVTDIRCGAAGLIAAAASENVVVRDPHRHLARGYPNLVGQLSRLGIHASAHHRVSTGDPATGIVRSPS